MTIDPSQRLLGHADPLRDRDGETVPPDGFVQPKWELENAGFSVGR